MKQIIEIKNRSLAEITDEEGIINVLKRVKCNERLSFIDDKAVIGKNTRIFFFTNIYDAAQIGSSCLIGSYVTIQGKGTKIGNQVRVGDYTFIPAWTIIEDEVFLSQHVSICNDKNPKSLNKEWKADPVIIRKGASIGSGAVILPGVELGENCMVGAGAIVTKSIPAGETWVGNPARLIKRKK